MVKVKNSEAKQTVAKRTITVTGVSVDMLRFVDEDGDVTSDVLDQIPKCYETVDIKITVELPEDESEE